MNIQINQAYKKNKRDLVKLLDSQYCFYKTLPFFHNLKKELISYYYALLISGKATSLLVAESEQKKVGLLAYQYSDWDSRLFNLNFIHIKYVGAIGNFHDQFRVKLALIKKVLLVLKKSKTEYLSIKVPCYDFALIHALQDTGFRLMDSTLTFVGADKHIGFPQVDRYFKVEELQREDLKEAGQLLDRRMFYNRFRMAQGIPKEKADHFYGSWLNTKFEESKNSKILVAKHDHRIIGCALFSLNSLLYKHTKVLSSHRGLVAVDPLAHGCFFAFFKTFVEQWPEIGFAELEIQGYNEKMVNLIQRLKMTMIGLSYTFHKKL